ncbi:hypothetical protein EN12_22705 [Vibrio cholerae]|uniref:Lipoprotein n=1 Tax=Vibrio cholerae TaxID=666 RepID=A0A5B1C165_VIBCL|nr:hypothetical protein [Vibrio cholerae]AKO77913.1 hypothetical protein EN12_22705 [Vibrio cholerae]KAA1253420.1 hypothetical protein F0M16_17965 [Vibrio cholerae]HDV5594382.1 hypothetical protein [Vibrio cholerae]
MKKLVITSFLMLLTGCNTQDTPNKYITSKVCDEAKFKEMVLECVKDGDWTVSYDRGQTYEGACKRFSEEMNCSKSKTLNPEWVEFERAKHKSDMKIVIKS